MTKRINSKSLRLPIVFHLEPEGGFTVTFPNLPGCVTYGQDFEQAVKMAKEAASLYLEDVVAENEKFLTPSSTYLGEIEIASPVKAHD